MTTSPLTDDQIKEISAAIFAAQPFTKFIGAELGEVGAGHAEIRVYNRADLQQQHGFIHGGVVSYLADNALTFAGGIALGGDAVTAEYKINYARPAVGDMLIARAQVISTTRTQAICQCLVYAVTADVERLIAAAQGTIVKAPKATD